MNTSDPRVIDYLNLAQEELMNEGDWPSVVARLRFRISGCKIVVPSEFDRIMLMTINGIPMQMQSPWFEFVGEGPDFLNTDYLVPPIDYNDRLNLGGLVGVIDREQVATFEDIPLTGGPYYPVVYGTADETGGLPNNRPKIIIRGYDANRNWVRSLGPGGIWMDGIELPINGDTPPFASTSTQSFSEVTAIIKPVTNGYVNLYVTNNTTAEVFIGSYAPRDTNPYYRRYHIPGLSPVQIYCVLARLRRRFFPARADNDFLLIGNLPALISMMQAVYYREAKDMENYTAYKATAIDIMRKETKAYVGLQRTKPLISFGEGTGVRLDGSYIL